MRELKQAYASESDKKLDIDAQFDLPIIVEAASGKAQGRAILARDHFCCA